MWIETLRVAWQGVRTNKLRSFLTMLGIIIGVMAVIMSFAVGVGAKVMITKQVESLGSNIITVMPGQSSVGGVNHGFGSASTMTYADVQRIAQDDPDVAAVSGLISYSGQVVYGANNTTTAIEGTDASYPSIRNITMAEGRFFLDQEVKQSATVAVLGSSTAQLLFTGTGVDPVGQTIEINQIPFTVIGVAAPQGSNGFQNLDDSVAIPITTEMNLFTGSDRVQLINASAVSADKMNEAQQEIESTLRVDHQLPPGTSDDFMIQNQATILSALSNITTILTILLGSISAISLLVGGIGIMNIMLVSVTERTREIGIRKAIGAKSSAILGQFLMESLALSLGGAITGLILGAGGTDAVAHFLKLGNLVSGTAVVVAVLFSIAVGVIFGVYPARKAARLRPVEALRYE
ncbi:MAG: ABC transporter permease [Alicyclobacillaceae bacterium]|nr:ABC transporter permease [Alicyclobacillaceae bacterium]